MRFLILQDIPMKTEQEKFSIAKCFERAFFRAGHTAIALDTRDVNYDLVKQTAENVDAIFITQNYFLETINYIDDFNKLKIFWSIDSHKDLEVHKKFIKEHKIDIALVAGFNYVDKFNKGIWFPNCYPSDLIKPVNFRNRPIDFGFCGSKSNRTEWLTELLIRANIHLAINKVAEDMVENICAYRIGWNRNESDDLNFRTFEVTGAGAMLLTNAIGGIELCYEPGHEVILYDSLEDCIDTVKYYLENEEDRLRIAINGYVRARQKHTFDSRASELIKIIETGDKI